MLATRMVAANAAVRALSIADRAIQYQQHARPPGNLADKLLQTRRSPAEAKLTIARSRVPETITGQTPAAHVVFLQLSAMSPGYEYLATRGLRESGVFTCRRSGTGRLSFEIWQQTKESPRRGGHHGGGRKYAASFPWCACPLSFATRRAISRRRAIAHSPRGSALWFCEVHERARPAQNPADKVEEGLCLIVRAAARSDACTASSRSQNALDGAYARSLTEICRFFRVRVASRGQ
jgi:hypothetical protein